MYNKIIQREETIKYQVVFHDYEGDDIPYTEEYFDSKYEADCWAQEYKYEYQDIIIDEEGNDKWVTITRYYNPEDKETYFGYHIEKNKTMKLQELRKLIREEITYVLGENNDLNHLKKFNDKIRVFDTKKMKSYEDVLPNEIEKIGGEIKVKDSFGEIYLVNRVKLKNGNPGYIWSKNQIFSESIKKLETQNI